MLMGCGHVFAQSAFPSVSNDPIINKDGKYVNGMNTVAFISGYNMLQKRVFRRSRVFTTPIQAARKSRQRRAPPGLLYGKAMFGTFFE